MKRYGEVIGSEKRNFLIRIYREKHGELFPTSLTLTASGSVLCDAGDIVEVEINPFLFLFSAITAYLLPFITTALAFFITRDFTDNILAIEAVILFVLILTYLCARYISATPFFKRLNACRITDIIEEE